MLHAVKFVRVPKDVYFFTRLDDPKVVKSLRYLLEGTPVVYGITCMVTQMIYIGSTLSPSKRFHKHLTVRDRETSNKALQDAIDLYGLHKFKVHIFEKVRFTRKLTYEEKKAFLRVIEQRYIDHFPKAQLYNSINSYTQ